VPAHRRTRIGSACSPSFSARRFRALSDPQFPLFAKGVFHDRERRQHDPSRPRTRHRRTLLKAAGATALTAGAVAATASPAAADDKPYDAIVVGVGYAGGTVAGSRAPAV
jgi:hypothetical protein